MMMAVQLQAGNSYPLLFPLSGEAGGLIAMLASYMGSLQLISDDEPDLLRQFKERTSVAAILGRCATLVCLSCWMG